MDGIQRAIGRNARRIGIAERNVCSSGRTRSGPRQAPFCAAIVLLLFGTVGAQLKALDRETRLDRFGRQTWQTDNGLPQNTIHTVLQTRDGYIWLGTEAGLVRFDGVQFAVYDLYNTPQLKSNNIRGLLEDRSGTLWIGTGDGLTRLRKGEFRTFTTQDGLPGNGIWSLYQDREGGIWAATTEGLAQFEGDRMRTYTVRNGLSSNTVNAIVEGVDGSLWIGTDAGLDQLRKDATGGWQCKERITSGSVHVLTTDRDGKLWIGTQEGLKIFAGGSFADFPLNNRLPTLDVEALWADGEGRIWIGTPSGLAVYTNGKLATYLVSSGLPSNHINSLYEDKEHSVWVSTDLGIARIIDGHVDTFPSEDGLARILVLAMCEDREGNLWLGTESSGLTILRDQKFTAYTEKDGLSDDFIRCVFADRNGVVWAGTNGGGLNRFDGHRFKSFTTAEGLSSNVVLSLAQDATGAVLVGTPDGLNRIHNGYVSVITTADGLPDDFVRSVYEDANGALWIGTRRGLSHFRNGKFKNYSQEDGLESDLVGALLRGHKGSLWIGTLGGLSQFRNGRFTNFTIKNGLSSNIVTALYEDSGGSLWIGTQGGGLNRYRDGKFTRFPSRLGLPDVIYSILSDERGHLWLTSNRGIFRVNKRELEGFAQGHDTALRVDSYGVADGMKISECSGGGHPAACKLRNGTLWFSTLRGIAAVDPARMHVNRVPPQVVLEGVVVDDTILNPRKIHDIAPGYTRIAFEYAGLSYVAPHKVSFRYKLEGFDKHWIDAGTRRVAYYTNIPPGTYRFHVLAANNDGVWSSKETSFSFRLRPHFYQTIWFDSLAGLVLVFCGYWIYRWRVRRVRQQFDAVLRERSRIAREIHDTLAQGFVAVSVQLELIARMLPVSTEAARERLDQARVMVRDSLGEARRSIWNLRSEDAEKEDLADRVTKMAERLTADTKIKVEFNIEGTYRPLSPATEKEVLRIMQEAITNVVRHAGAKRIKIGLKFDTRKLYMRIADDGRGFSMPPPSSPTDGHFGLEGMRERAEQIRGELTIKSAPGEGTTVLLEAVIQ